MRLVFAALALLLISAVPAQAGVAHTSSSPICHRQPRSGHVDHKPGQRCAIFGGRLASLS
jgi:hypothetical protein